jgi:hypothetical protein
MNSAEVVTQELESLPAFLLCVFRVELLGHLLTVNFSIAAAEPSRKKIMKVEQEIDKCAAEIQMNGSTHCI